MPDRLCENFRGRVGKNTAKCEKYSTEAQNASPSNRPAGENPQNGIRIVKGEVTDRRRGAVRKRGDWVCGSNITNPSKSTPPN